MTAEDGTVAVWMHREKHSYDKVDAADAVGTVGAGSGVASNSLARGVEPRIAKQEINSIRYLELSYPIVLALFALGSIVGLALETVYHALVFGGLESRAGLVWGPFSPLYGCGAVILTVVLNSLWNYNNAVIFLVSSLIGTSVEFATSWGMEHFFGAFAWDYTGTFLNIQGRVNLEYAVMWGLLGLIWARMTLPLIKRSLASIDWSHNFIRFGTLLLTVYLALDIIVTVQVLARERERANGLPAITQADQFFDAYYPSSFVTERFANMTVYGADD